MSEAPAPLDPHAVEAAVIAALEEDGAFSDVTTLASVAPSQCGRGKIVAKDAGVVAGLPVAAAAFSALDASILFDTLVAEGAAIARGSALAEVEGPLAPMLSAERVALNFLQRLSGIATLTRQFVDAVVGTRAQILDTRKTTPGLRALERYAVRTGGGRNHRYNLADGVLIKDNHIAAARARGLDDAERLIAVVRAGASHTHRIEIEVTSVDEAVAAAAAGADIVLLDNMSVDDMRRAVDAVAGRALIEASGGITLENVRAVAETGVDFISVGRLTHSAPALDISFEIVAD